MGTRLSFTLEDGFRAVAVFPDGPAPPAHGAPCLLRVDGVTELARRTVDTVCKGGADKSVRAEFAGFAAEADLKRAKDNAALAARAKDTVKKFVCGGGGEISRICTRFSLRRERLTVTLAMTTFLDIRPLRDRLENETGARVDVKTVSPRDIAAAVCGVGPCGRTLCCAHGRAADPKRRTAAHGDAFNGVCGRFCCCLAFESNDKAGDGASAASVNVKAK